MTLPKVLITMGLLLLVLSACAENAQWDPEFKRMIDLIPNKVTLHTEKLPVYKPFPEFPRHTAPLPPDAFDRP